MFLIDGPYVSDYLKQTLQNLKIPIIQTAYAQQALAGYEVKFVTERQAVQAFDVQSEFYTNSENALEWILSQFPSSALAVTIGQVKDKVRFRDVLSELHPAYYYRACPYSELEKFDPDSIPFPIILKPSIGFFSLGVQRIEDKKQWKSTLSKLDELIGSYEDIYPTGVLDNNTFIVEAVIPGDEFAVDCYYDDQGQVVILNMMKHLFASGDDVNDRVYVTSAAIVEQYLTPIQRYLNQLGSLFNLKHFQAHIEIRINHDEIAAIEINPLRFGGWCSTADLAQYAWGMNIYEALVTKSKPDWTELVLRAPSRVYALIVLNNSTGVPGTEIVNFDYDRLLENIQNPLELRKTDFTRFPLFGFLMCQVPANNLFELERLLHSDLSEFITTYSG
ncbi:MAG: ATP-grasp domain-containing protein [Candidatus Marinimicrobia bacterium]|nr:ATP-grasp domain-containing protein [Candidatus Neomarinimicrobiota bacterium]